MVDPHTLRTRVRRATLGLALALVVAAPEALAQSTRPSAQTGPRRGPGGGFARQNDDKNVGFRENPKMLAAFKDVVAGPSMSVARIRCDGKDVALGTVVGADGWVLTKNSELLANVTPMVVLRDGRTFPSKVTGVDNKNDLAMLKIEAKGLPAVRWREERSTSAVPVGELLAAPAASGDAPAGVGVLSVASRPVKARDLPPSAPPANSGFLGVGLEEAQGGARIFTIVANSAAAKAGLHEGDVVTLIADTPIIDSETMVNTIQHHKPGDTIAIKLKRGAKELEVQATLDKRPPEMAVRRDFQNHLGSELSNRRGGFPQIIQTDLVLRPSDCGGPVVDLDGRAVGVTIARAGRVETYALPADAVRALIPDLQSGKLAPRPEELATTAAPAATSRPATPPATRPAAATGVRK
jgi:serine protease Do